MQAGVSANAYDEAGWSPLHRAAAAGQLTTCWLLLQTPWDATDDFGVPNRVLPAPIIYADGGTEATAGGAELSDPLSGHAPLEMYPDGSPGTVRTAVGLDEDQIKYTWTEDGQLMRSRLSRFDVYGAELDPEVLQAELDAAAVPWTGPRAELNAGVQNITNVYGDEARQKFDSLAGETALHLASRSGHLEVVNLLLSNVSGQAADINSRTVANINKGVGMGETALHYAAKHGKTSVVRSLVDADAQVDALTTQGWTPLHYAARAGYMDVVTLLVQRGADLRAVTHTERDVVDVAHESVEREIAGLFAEHGVARPSRAAEGRRLEEAGGREL